MDEKPPSFDWSAYHPLDHGLTEWRYCHGLPGGWRNHLQLEWEYRKGAEIRGWFQEQFRCRFGSHNYRAYWVGNRILRQNLNDIEPNGYVCSGCGNRKETNAK